MNFFFFDDVFSGLILIGHDVIIEEFHFLSNFGLKICICGIEIITAFDFAFAVFLF
jgi:hypothetical protein